MTTKTFIFAGTRALRGYSTWGKPRLFTGTFYERPDATELLRMLHIADSTGRPQTESCLPRGR